jgi:hypothetical protein
MEGFMNFWQVFWPVFSAMLSVLVIMEMYQLGLGYILRKKQDALRKDLEAKIASGEINPMAAMLGGAGFGGNMPEFPSFPTTSGQTNGEDRGHGTYM